MPDGGYQPCLAIVLDKHKYLCDLGVVWAVRQQTNSVTTDFMKTECTCELQLKEFKQRRVTYKQNSLVVVLSLTRIAALSRITFVIALLLISHEVYIDLY